MKKKIKSLLSGLLILSMLMTMVCVSPFSTKEVVNATENNSFTLYFYYEGNETLYMDIWNHAGIEFAEGTTTSTEWGWNHAQGILQLVEGNQNWYSIDVDIIADANDGFDIYKDQATKLATYDNQWNNTSDYAVLVGKSADAYAIKSSTVYTDLEQAGLTFNQTNNDTFTLYYYYEGSETLYMDIWNHAGIEFAEGTTTSSEWGWNHSQGVIQSVEGNQNWYSIDVDIIADANDGFDIYKDSSTKLATYDNQWNNTADYAILVGKTSNVYSIKDGVISTEAPKKTDNDTAVEADVYVEKIAGLSDDFITGADVSSYLSLINSGAKFYDEDGQLLDEQGFFTLLAAKGTNYIRIRVWNNPFNDNGNGYGGGNNDLETAKVIGQYATNAGMKVLIDFHYSDFWADPGKQQAPKDWKDMSLTEKETAVYEYTKSSLIYLRNAGVNVGMVQVGNETNGKFCGESDWTNICTLFSAGSRAIREVSSNILVAVHFTNPEKAGLQASYAKKLNDNNVDYDVFATSYYPYWHGTIANLTSVLKSVADTYNKKVMVAETSWAFSLEDGDGHENTVRVGNNDSDQPYEFSVQGQCTEIASVAKAVANVGEAGIGLFYWEAAWIPVGYAYDENGNLIQSVYNANKTAWETYGSGWASSYAGEYDPNDAGNWYGGSAVDNQAWFDFEGKAIETVNIYNYIRTGTKVAEKVTGVSATEVKTELSKASEATMPTSVTVKYNSGRSVEAAVTWNDNEIKAAIAAGIGSYTINGTYVIDEQTGSVSTTLTIIPDNLLSNAGFETGSLDPWGAEEGSTGAVTKDDPHSGAKSYHYYSLSEVGYTVSQNVTVKAGIYTFGGYMQGQAKTDGESYQIFVMVGNTKYTADVNPNGWAEWQNPEITNIVIAQDMEITIGFSASATAGAWGTWDDFYLNRVAGYKAPEAPKEESKEPEKEEMQSTPEPEQTPDPEPLKSVPVVKKEVKAPVSVDAPKSKVTTNKKGEATIDTLGKTTAPVVLVSSKVTIDGVTYKVTSVGEEAFAKCGKDTWKVTLPKSINKLEANAFTGSKLKQFNVYSRTSLKVSKKAFEGVDTSKMTVKVTMKMSKEELKKFKKALAAAGFEGKVVQMKYH